MNGCRFHGRPTFLWMFPAAQRVFFWLPPMFSFTIYPSFCCIFLLQSCAAVPNSLPEGNIIAAWQNWGACNESQTLLAVERGVNVIFWFSLNLVKEDNQPKISGAIPDLECVARVRSKILEKKLPTRHLISIGGWDAPHPDTSFSGAEWFEAWHQWNQNLPMPFAGFDWDLEGLMAEDPTKNERRSEKSGSWKMTFRFCGPFFLGGDMLWMLFFFFEGVIDLFSCTFWNVPTHIGIQASTFFFLDCASSCR